MNKMFETTCLCKKKDRRRSKRSRDEQTNEKSSHRRSFVGNFLCCRRICAIRFYSITRFCVLAMVQPSCYRPCCWSSVEGCRQKKGYFAGGGFGAFGLLCLLQFYRISRPYKLCGRHCVRRIAGSMAYWGGAIRGKANWQ